MRTRLESRRTFSAGSVLGERKRSAAGYTFAEVLVAAAILGVVATSLYAAFSGGFFIIQSTRENLRATQVMVQKLEAIRLLTWSQLGNTNYLKPVFTEPYD